MHPCHVHDETLYNNSNNLQLLTIATKSSILNVTGTLDPPISKARGVDRGEYRPFLRLMTAFGHTKISAQILIDQLKTQY